MKRILAVALLATLAGCANLKFEWKASYKTDNLAQDLKEAGK
ncbi:hypothetical protein [Massilia sp. BKSP1R2A-1]